MRLTVIQDLLQCVVFTEGGSLDLEVETAVASDGMSAVLASPHPRALMITGLTHIQSVKTAHVADIVAILYVRGDRPNEKAIDLARQKGIVLLGTASGMFDCCGILHAHGLRGAI